MYILNTQKDNKTHELDLVDFQKRLTMTNKHFFTSTNQNYVLFEHLTKSIQSRVSIREFINPTNQAQEEDKDNA
jgi:hypothetical protein